MLRKLDPLTPHLDEDARMLRDMLGNFGESKLRPHAFAVDEGKLDVLRPEMRTELAELGLFGLYGSETYGGAGLSRLSKFVAMREIAAACPSTSMVLGAQGSLTTLPILVHGTDEQRAHYLPKMATGELLGCYALTEPDAGSNTDGKISRCRQYGDKFILNGTAAWVTNGSIADFAIVFCISSEDRSSWTAFLIDMNDPKVSRKPDEKKHGLGGSRTCEFSYEQLVVDESAVLGGVGNGKRVAFGTLAEGRISVAAQALGMGEQAFELAVRYATTRPVMGGLLSDQQLTRDRIAGMRLKLDLATLLTLDAIRMDPADTSLRMRASQAKVAATEAAWEVTDCAMQLHGGMGYSRDSFVELLHRAVRAGRIYEGTSEVQRVLIQAPLILREL